MDGRDVHEVSGGIGRWITRRAFYSGDQIAVIDGNRRLSYSELDRRTDLLASALRALGVRRGDRVATLQHNCAEFFGTVVRDRQVGRDFRPRQLPARATGGDLSAVRFRRRRFRVGRRDFPSSPVPPSTATESGFAPAW